MKERENEAENNVVVPSETGAALTPEQEVRFKEMQAAMIKASSDSKILTDRKKIGEIRMSWIYKNSGKLRELVIKDPSILDRFKEDPEGTRALMEQELSKEEPVN